MQEKRLAVLAVGESHGSSDEGTHGSPASSLSVSNKRFSSWVAPAALALCCLIPALQAARSLPDDTLLSNGAKSYRRQSATTSNSSCPTNELPRLQPDGRHSAFGSDVATETERAMTLLGYQRPLTETGWLLNRFSTTGDRPTFSSRLLFLPSFQ